MEIGINLIVSLRKRKNKSFNDSRVTEIFISGTKDKGIK